MQSNTGPQDPLFIDVNNVALSRGPQHTVFNNKCEYSDEFLKNKQTFLKTSNVMGYLI
jgi:hypothetical protein